MTRFTWMAVAMAGFLFTFAGCGDEATEGDAKAEDNTTEVQNMLDAANISPEEYNKSMENPEDDGG